MTAVLEANIARSLAATTPAVEDKDWVPDRGVTLGELRIVDMIHEGKPTCRLCGQVVNRLDTFGLCSKTSQAHQEWRGIAPKKKGASR